MLFLDVTLFLEKMGGGVSGYATISEQVPHIVRKAFPSLVSKKKTPAYHPQANGMVERSHISTPLLFSAAAFDVCWLLWYLVMVWLVVTLWCWSDDVTDGYWAGSLVWRWCLTLGWRKYSDGPIFERIWPKTFSTFSPSYDLLAILLQQPLSRIKQASKAWIGLTLMSSIMMEGHDGRAGRLH